MIKGLFNDNAVGVNDVGDDIKEGVAISLIAKMAHRGERGWGAALLFNVAQFVQIKIYCTHLKVQNGNALIKVPIKVNFCANLVISTEMTFYSWRGQIT